MSLALLAPLFIALSYLSLTLLPLAPLLFGRPLPPHLFPVFGLALITWIAVWAFFKRPARFHWLLLPAFLLLPAELYLQAHYGQGVSPHHLGIALESSPSEAKEFLGSMIWLLTPAILGVCLWWWLCWRAARITTVLDWRHPSRRIVLAALLAIGALTAYGFVFGIAERHPGRKASAMFTTLPPLPHWLKPSVSPDVPPASWPFGVLLRGMEFWKERRYLEELTRKSRDFTFGAGQEKEAGSRAQTFVVVIGESSRYDRWSLNGYSRRTNPLLEKEANLVSLSDLITSVSATRLSVPVLLSRKPATQSLQAGFGEKSFISAFKEAGFRTFWLSNQVSFGRFDTPVSVFAKEADETQFLNLGGLRSPVSYDGVLLGPLQKALDSPAQKKLIVLHTLGNHWNYGQRYPQEFDRWKPSLFGTANPSHHNIALKTEMNNSYDNSILYTDWLLAQVLAQLKAKQQIAVMIYVSDHGQTIYDGNCKIAFHGHNTQFEFHVPALVWTSDEYRAAYPSQVRHLLQNRDAKLTTENVFHTLLDLAHIRYPDERLERSFVNPAFRPHKRYVDSYGWTDYDNASLRGDCREVIDRGTPLAQEY